MTNFLDKIVAKLQLDTKKLILIFVLFFVVIYLDFTFLINMQSSNIKSLKPKIAKFKKDIDALNKSLSAGGNINTDQNQANVLRIISKDQVSLLLEEISTLANNNDVKIMQIKAVKDFKKTDKTPQSDKFEPLFVSLDISGTYHDVGAFINDLESGPVFIAVSDLDIKYNDSDSSRQSVNLLLKTYVKK